MTALPIAANTGRLSTWEGKDPAGKAQTPPLGDGDKLGEQPADETPDVAAGKRPAK